MLRAKFNARGFTLVELLIVIALIGVLATALVATLNPIEQVNKARDARYANDAAELLAALERAYASTQSYPWVGLSDGLSINDSWGGVSTFYGTGVCGVAGGGSPSSTTPGDCSVNGVLIQADELKPAFKGKTQFSNPGTNLEDALFLWKEAGSSGSVYVCYVPKSKTNRTKTTDLRCLDTTSEGAPQGYERAGSGSCVAPTDPGATTWTQTTNSGTNAIFICVPE